MNKLKLLRHAAEMGATLGVVCTVVIFAQTAALLPTPSVDDLGGDPRLLQYGFKMLMLGIFMAGCGIMGLLFLLGRFPRLHVYPVEMNAHNIDSQYNLAKTMYSSLVIVCAVYVCFLMAGLYKRTIVIPSSAFTALSLGSIGAAITVYAIYQIAARRIK